MSADPAPSAVEPSALDELRKLIPLAYYWNRDMEGSDKFRDRLDVVHDKLAIELAALRAENGRLVAERDELANWIKRIRGQAESAMAVLHGDRSTVNLEVEDTLPTAK